MQTQTKANKLKSNTIWTISVIIIPLVMTALAPLISKVMCSSKKELMLKGQLKNSLYEVIANVTVIIPKIGTDTTDANGIFEIPHVKTEVSRLEWLGCSSCKESTTYEIHFQIGDSVCIQNLEWDNSQINNNIIEQSFLFNPACIK